MDLTAYTGGVSSQISTVDITVVVVVYLIFLVPLYLFLREVVAFWKFTGQTRRVRKTTLRHRMEAFERLVGPNQFNGAEGIYSAGEYNNLSTLQPIIARVIPGDHVTNRDLQTFFKYLHADLVVDFGKEVVIVFYPNEKILFNGNIQKLVGAITRITSMAMWDTSVLTFSSSDAESTFMDVKVFNVDSKYTVVEYLLWCGNRLHSNKNPASFTRVMQGRDLPVTSLHQNSTYNKKMWSELLKLN